MIRWLIVVLLLAPLCAAQDIEAAVSNAVASLRYPPKGILQYKLPEFTVQLSDDMEVNAFGNPSTHVVTLNKILVRILERDPGELAFVIAHELGHIQDSACQARAARAGLRGRLLTRYCEQTADKIGMQYILAAGYNPFEPAGFIGKILMIDSQNSLGGTILARLANDHPADLDRVKQLAQDARDACHERPEICRQ